MLTSKFLNKWWTFYGSKQVIVCMCIFIYMYLSTLLVISNEHKSSKFEIKLDSIFEISLTLTDPTAGFVVFWWTRYCIIQTDTLHGCCVVVLIFHFLYISLDSYKVWMHVTGLKTNSISETVNFNLIGFTLLCFTLKCLFKIYLFRSKNSLSQKSCIFNMQINPY